MPSTQKIKTVKPSACPNCGGDRMRSKGYTSAGTQAWRCVGCYHSYVGLKITDQLLAGESAAAPDGYSVHGTSTLYNADGKPTLQWVKTNIDAEQRRLQQEAALAALCERLEPLPAVKAPRATQADLAVLYTLTDCHVGMLAWKRETGEAWDLDIAERVLGETFMAMIEAAPAAETGIVNQLGDFLHFDSLTAITPEHGNILDADSRYQKVVEVAVRILRRIISAALAKHKYVRVYMHEGNHDPAGSVWLRVMFAHLYAGNPRVYVEQSPTPYVVYQHGKTMLGFHHGHLSKLAELPILFAGSFPVEWGTSEYRYIHTGHKHAVEEREHPGIKIIQHPTLAAPDAYAIRNGWLSKRQASSITYSKRYGEVARATFLPYKE